MSDPIPDAGSLDQAVIDAGRAYAAALMATPFDTTAVQAALETLEQARSARGYPDA